jgi:uncharacterized membrane protein
MGYLLIGFGWIFVIFGLICRYVKLPRNRIIGFRYSVSFKNNDTWRETNRYGGKLMIIFGIMEILVRALAKLVFKVDFSSIVNMIIVLTMLAVIFVMPIIHYYKVFDQNGNRKK